MTSQFVKLNPYLYDDKSNILDKMESICCDRDYCHNHTLSYHKKSPHILILSLFHKGCYMYSILYNYQTRSVTFKTSSQDMFDTLSKFIDKNDKQIKGEPKKNNYSK